VIELDRLTIGAGATTDVRVNVVGAQLGDPGDEGSVGEGELLDCCGPELR